jgi:ubiquinone/menaquinone biosynthesis C-methylase UbiE
VSSFYERHILPRAIRCACGTRLIRRQRAKIVPRATGAVLELGIGGGLNLPFYDRARVTSITGIDPSEPLRRQAAAAAREAGLVVRVLPGEAESLPFADRSFDTVVCTFTLCSVHSHARALHEARRVLRPGGLFLFFEHGLAPDPDVERWLRRLEPLWARLAGGCHLTRPVAANVTTAGFQVVELQKMYLPKTPRILGWSEWGCARRT